MNVYKQLILSDDYNEDVYKIVSSVYFIVNYSSLLFNSFLKQSYIYSAVPAVHNKLVLIVLLF